jgi:hypothetical protein
MRVAHQGDRVEQRLPRVFSFHGLGRGEFTVYVCIRAQAT